MKDKYRPWRISLIGSSLASLTLSIGAGLLHTWHRVIFISLMTINNSGSAVLALMVAAIICWMAATYLPYD
jgi:hypothetical protein